MRIALLACVLVACGKGESTPKKRDDAGAPRDGTAALTLDAVPLGLADLESYAWRKRAGHPAFRTARTAEAREDWTTVVSTCQQALAADPSHLEAAWLLAAAYGRLGKHDDVLAPLVKAVAGDFGKWGHASLELPALAAFLATPTGQAWSRRIESDRQTYVAAISRSVILEADGDFFAFDTETKRWNRLTRTYGAVIGGMRVDGANKIVYVTRQGPKGKKQFGVGVIDFARGRTTRPIEVGNDPISVTYQTKTNPGIWFSANKRKDWSRIDESKVVALPPKTPRPPGAYLDIRGRKAKLRSLPVAEVIADWDDHGLASAIRIGKSNRIVSVPSPGLIDGNTAQWSADRVHLAFAAQLADECTPGSISSAAFIADAATGKSHELERAAKGIAVEWISDHELAVAGDSGVAIYDLQSNANTKVEGARGLVAPKQRPKCTASEPDQPDPDIDDPDAGESGASVETDVKNP